MDSPRTFYLYVAHRHYVLAYNKRGLPSGVVLQLRGKSGDEQKWTIEQGDEPNTIALHNVASGNYMRSNKPESHSKVGTGDKEWWKIDIHEKSPPGTFRLAPMVDSSPRPCFLNFLTGSALRSDQDGTEVNLMHDSQYESYLTKNFYLVDTSATFNTEDIVPPPSSATSKEDSDAKLKALEDREAALTQRENDKSAELDKRAKKLQERQDSLDREEKNRAASKTDFDSKLKALEDREATLTQKDKDRSAQLDKKVKEIQERQDRLAQEAKDREAASTKKANDASEEWEKMEEEVQERRAALAKDEKDRAASYEKKLKELQARENEMAKKEKEQKSSKDASSKSGKDAATKAQSDKKEAETQRKLDDLKSTEQKLAADRASLEKSKADFAAEQQRFQKRQRAFENQRSPSQNDVAHAKNENAALEKRMAQLEEQLDQMSASGRKNNKPEKPQANGTDTSASACNYSGLKHYRPPRKLGRKVIGIVYE